VLGTGALAALGSAACALAALAFAACEANPVHIFAARRYDAANDCLEDNAGADVIAGPDPGPCDQTRCWVSPAGDVYVADLVCDAPPEYTEGTTDTTGPCVKALAAYARKGHARCMPAGADGGTDSGANNGIDGGD
jgi:hypothetical protein